MKTENNYQIKYHPLENDQSTINPCLVVFPLNYPNIDEMNDPHKAKWLLGQNKEKKLKSDKSFLGMTSKILYESRSKPTTNRSEYVIGVLSKKTKRAIDFYDVDAIFSMNQKIRKVEKNASIIETEDTTGANKLELMTNFGTAKAQKLAMTMKTNLVGEKNISSVNVAKKMLKKTAEETNVLKLEDEAKLNQMNIMNEVLPAFDSTAKKVNDIFDFSTVIDNEKVIAIEVDGVIACLKENGKGLNEYHLCEFCYEYLLGLIPKVKEGKNHSNKIRYALYTNELIKFYLLPKIIKETPQGLSDHFHIEKSHVEIMLEKYTKCVTDNGGKVNYSKNKILILKNTFHILTLALLLNSFEFNFTSLAKSMRVETKTIAQYYKEIGCSIKNSKEGKGKGCVAELKAPLKINFSVKNFGKKN